MSMVGSNDVLLFVLMFDPYYRRRLIASHSADYFATDGVDGFLQLLHSQQSADTVKGRGRQDDR